MTIVVSAVVTVVEAAVVTVATAARLRSDGGGCGAERRKERVLHAEEGVRERRSVRASVEEGRARRAKLGSVDARDAGST